MTAAGHMTVHNLVAMSYAKDPRVDDYIDRLPEWQQAIKAIIGRNRAGGRRKLSNVQ